MKNLVLACALAVAFATNLASAYPMNPMGTYYLQVNDLFGNMYNVSCRMGDAIVGVSFENDDDRSLGGIYCANVTYYPGQTRYVQVNDMGGSSYPVGCGYNEYVSGVRYENSGDDSIVGMFCTQANRNIYGGNYVQVAGLSWGGNSTYPVYCYNGQVMTGVHYQNEGDDHEAGIYCGNVQ